MELCFKANLAALFNKLIVDFINNTTDLGEHVSLHDASLAVPYYFCFDSAQNDYINVRLRAEFRLARENRPAREVWFDF